jgi:hypothetical protein
MYGSGWIIPLFLTSAPVRDEWPASRLGLFSPGYEIGWAYEWVVTTLRGEILLPQGLEIRPFGRPAALPTALSWLICIYISQSCVTFEGIPSFYLFHFPRVNSDRRERLRTSRPSMSWLSSKCGSLNISQPHGPPRSVTGITLLLPILFYFPIN